MPERGDTWHSRALKEFLSGVIDYRGKTPPGSSSGIPVLTAAHVKYGAVVHCGSKFVSNETYGRWTTRGFIRPGDLLITTEAPVAQVARVPDDQTYLITRRVIALQVDPSKGDEGFLLYYMLNPRVRERLEALGHGTTVPRLYKEDILDFEVRAPDVGRQRRIASILSAYDDLIENNTRRIAILEEMAKAIYREWFVNFRFPGHENVEMVESELGLIPEGWEVLPFSSIADILSGGTPKTKVGEYWGGPIPFFSPKDAPSSIFVTETERTVTQAGVDACSSDLFPPWTVFITARGTVGRLAMPHAPMAMNQSCYALTGRAGVSQPFVFFAIGQCIGTLQQRAHGAVFDTIIKDTFDHLLVPKPPLELTSKFARMVTPMLELNLRLTLSNQVLRQTRDLLLPKLISGEIDVNEFSDELEEAIA